jgi:hypothetical protein
MTPDEALLLLGLDESNTWADIRRAYRAKIRQAHPDAGGSFEPAASLNDAMAVLTRAFAPAGTMIEPVTDAMTEPATEDLVFVAPQSEVFDRLRRALDEIADVVAVDADAGLLVGDLRREIGAGRLVVEVHSPVDRAQSSTVEFTLDQVGADPPPRIDDVVRELARLVRGT